MVQMMVREETPRQTRGTKWPKRPVIPAPTGIIHAGRVSTSVQKAGTRGGRSTSTAIRRRDKTPGLAQAPPVRAGRVEPPVGVGWPGGGSQPCGPCLGTPRACHHPPPARLFFSAAGEELDLRYEGNGAARAAPSPGAIMLVAGRQPHLGRWSGSFDDPSSSSWNRGWLASGSPPRRSGLDPGAADEQWPALFRRPGPRRTSEPRCGRLTALSWPRRRPGTAGRRVAGQRPGRPPGSGMVSFNDPPIRAPAERHAPPSEAPSSCRVH